MSIAARYYKELPEHKAGWLLPVRMRRAQMQKYAGHMRDDPTFPWAEWADAVINESLFLEAGVYRVEGERQTWAAATAECVLCYGKNRPFHTPAEVPKAIMAEVRKGAARARARAAGRRARFTGAELGNKLRMTWAIRDDLKCWQIWPAGATREDLDQHSKERARAKREAGRAERAEAEMTRRRQSGAVSRAEYLDQAALRREACELAGISDATFKRRSEEEKAELLNAAKTARCNEPSPCHGQYNSYPVHGLSSPTEDAARVVIWGPDGTRLFECVGGSITVLTAPLIDCKKHSVMAPPANEPGTSPSFDTEIPPPISADPPPTVEPDCPPPTEEMARWDWPDAPVQGWTEGRLIFRNLLTGAESDIDLRARENLPLPEGELSPPYWELDE